MAVPKQLRKWHKHVMAIKRANPKLSLKEVLEKAHRSYEG